MKTVLIVEDEETLARLYQKSVTDPNLKVLIARDGEEGLGVAKKEALDLIVTDFMMPKMNGLEMLEALKAEPNLKNIPVVMLSNLTQPDDEKLALSKGALAFWSKRNMPPRMIVEKITELLHENTA